MFLFDKIMVYIKIKHNLLCSTLRFWLERFKTYYERFKWFNCIYNRFLEENFLQLKKPVVIVVMISFLKVILQIFFLLWLKALLVSFSDYTNFANASHKANSFYGIKNQHQFYDSNCSLIRD